MWWWRGRGSLWRVIGRRVCLHGFRAVSSLSASLWGVLGLCLSLPPTHTYTHAQPPSTRTRESPFFFLRPAKHARSNVRFSWSGLCASGNIWPGRRRSRGARARRRSLSTAFWTGSTWRSGPGWGNTGRWTRGPADRPADRTVRTPSSGCCPYSIPWYLRGQNGRYFGPVIIFFRKKFAGRILSALRFCLYAKNRRRNMNAKMHTKTVHLNNFYYNYQTNSWKYKQSSCLIH